MNCLLLIVLGIYWGNLFIITYLSTHTVYQYEILFFFSLWGGGNMAIMENGYRKTKCFKLSKKTEKLLNKQPTHAIAKCTLTGLVQ